MKYIRRKNSQVPINGGLKEKDDEKQILSRSPPEAESNKAQIHDKFHEIPEIPEIRFEDQKLTSFSDLLIFQTLFLRLI